MVIVVMAEVIVDEIVEHMLFCNTEEKWEITVSNPKLCTTTSPCGPMSTVFSTIISYPGSVLHALNGCVVL